jgi:dTDP-4-amino-4,6-dideoxygalactose transaminase
VTDCTEEWHVREASETNEAGRGEISDVPFNLPAVEGRELEYVQQAVLSGHPASGGEFAKRASALLAEETGAEEVLLTTSCTSALELSAMLLDVGPGDTVIVPSFTFTTTALAFARQGAGLVFCDIERQTLGLDPAHLVTLLDETVRAVVVVHYAGIACDIEGIRAALAPWPDITLVEDNAHGLFGTWQGEQLGSLGRFAALSFHETKNFVCGEGGALLLNEPRDVDRARVLYDKGTNRRAFMLGQVEKYTWKDTGSSFGLADVLAAYLLAQLERRESIQAKRRAIHESYTSSLAPWADELGFELAEPPRDGESAHHMFYVLLSTRDRRNDVLEAMRKSGVSASFHYLPLHASDAGKVFAARATDCPVSDDVSGRLLRLPFYNNLSAADLDRTVDAFRTAAQSTLQV